MTDVIVDGQLHDPRHILPTDLLVGVRDLEVGDIMVARYPIGNTTDFDCGLTMVDGTFRVMAGRRNFFGIAQVIVSLDSVTESEVRITIRRAGEFSATLQTKWLPSDRFWIRQRSLATNGRFPHRCPYCARVAYVSALSVEHADGRGCL